VACPATASFTINVSGRTELLFSALAIALFSTEEARRNLIVKDPQAQFALQQFSE
jgi:hypothetical protein